MEGIGVCEREREGERERERTLGHIVAVASANIAMFCDRPHVAVALYFGDEL
jgi:hypothetical protein